MNNLYTVEDVIKDLSDLPSGTIIEGRLNYIKDGICGSRSYKLPDEVDDAMWKAKLLAIGRYKETHPCA